MIGEFLQTSSVDPPSTTKVEGNTLTITLKDSPLPSSTTKPSDPQQATEGSDTKPLNIRVKRKSKKNYAPLPVKMLLGASKPRDS